LVTICVIGGGSAGEEAAFEADLRGARVTIVERSANQELSWRSWPELISQSLAKGGLFGGHRKSSMSVLTTEAKCAGSSYVTLHSGDRLRFDSIIIATGSRFMPVSFPGARKSGLYILDGAEKYEELGRACPSMDKAVVTGEGYRGLEVAERLCSFGVEVLLMISCWQYEAPAPVVVDVIEDAARERGIEVQRGDVTKAVGNSRVEAVVAGGSVIPCDTVIVAPPRVPNPVHSSLRIGRRGGIEVDRAMRTSEPSVFAAGGCAELKGSIPGPGTLTAEPSLSGRIAGSNSMGSTHSIGGARIDQLRVFGLGWSRIGRRTGLPMILGNQVETVSQRWGPASACVITHERSSERVIGVESIQPFASSPAGLPPLASGVTLEALAYGLGSSDISQISETARLGLREWRKS
jgi:pyruvate/2-oxoglutarate dehydrogenase complex dihydrolipoamide dehydrogenase (E3) component